MANAWEVEVDSCTPEKWSNYLNLFNDSNIYQTWSYGEVRWGTRNLSHIVLKRNGEVAAMAQLRIVRPTRLDFGLAYLRWGPVCERSGIELDGEVVMEMSRALQREYVTKRKLSLQVLPNAFMGSRRAEIFRSAFEGFNPNQNAANTYRTFLLDLSPSLEELRKRLDKKWRNQLSRAEKNNLRVVSGNGLPEFRRFCIMYSEMKKRKSFETTVDVNEFSKIHSALPGSQRLLILTCEDASGPLAGLVASLMGDSAIYLLGATSDRGLNAKGAYLLQWTLIQWLKEKNAKWYDLGGIDPEHNPGVYHFKKGLGGVDSTQLCPMAACDNALSSAAAMIGLAMQKQVWQRVRGLTFRSLAQRFTSEELA